MRERGTTVGRDLGLLSGLWSRAGLFAHAPRLARRAAAACIAAAAIGLPFLDASGGRAWAQGGDVVEDAGGEVRHVVVTLFKSRTVKIGRPFASTVVGQPEIADVLPMTDSKLYIQGKRVGTTNISVFDPKKQLIAVVDLEIVPDTGTLHNKIMASTGQDIRVSSANGQVVLSGEVSDAVAAARAVEIAKGLSPAPVIDAMKVSPSQQVMLKVRILEVDRNAERDLGVNWSGVSSRVSGVAGLTPQVNPYTTAAGTAGAVGVFPGAASATAPFGALLASIVNTHGVNISTMVSALEEKGLVKSLAEPDLIALSGGTANFLVGGQIPVPVVQPGSPPTYTVEWKNYGVGLVFTPTVLNKGLINLRLEPSVTEIDSTNSVQVNGTTVPQLTVRDATTTVELRDGQSFAIAGLLQANVNQNISQLPWLGNVPILGTLFRSTAFQKNESDLVIIVSPHLVRPAPPGQELATPFDQNLQANDIDLFVMGNMERKKKYTEYVTSGGNLKGPYGYILPGE